MSAILDVPEIRARVHLLTVAEYRVLAEEQPGYEHAELIRGIIVEKEMKTPSHNSLVDAVAEYLRHHVHERLWVRQEASLLLADSVPEPDVAVIRGARADYRDRHPTVAELVVEIAVTTLASDREKAALYAEAGVGEYWIVLAGAERVEVYRRPEEGTYQERRTYRRGESIEGVVITSEAVAVDSLFA